MRIVLDDQQDGVAGLKIVSGRPESARPPGDRATRTAGSCITPEVAGEGGSGFAAHRGRRTLSGR